MSFEFTMLSFTFSDEIFPVTPDFRKEATQHTLTPAAIAANLHHLQNDGVMEDFLTPTRAFGVAMAREIIRRRDGYHKQPGSARSVAVGSKTSPPAPKGNVIEELQRLLATASTSELPETLRVERCRLTNALEQLGGMDLTKFPGLKDLEADVMGHLNRVEAAELELRIKEWMEGAKSLFLKRQSLKSVSSRAGKVWQVGGLGAAEEFLSNATMVAAADYDEEVPDPNHRIALFLSEGRIPQRPALRVVRSFEPRRVGSGPINMDARRNGLPARNLHLVQSQEADGGGEDILVGVVFFPVGYEKGGVVLGASEGADTNIRLDRTNKEEPGTDRPCDVRVVKRASNGTTYVYFIGYTKEAQEALAS